MGDWTDSIVGDRMAVDREFSRRVHDSGFSNQEWGLIMTVTEFEIENADDPERARIVANTENVPSIVPELEKVRSQPGPMGGESDDRAAGGGFDGGSGGVVDSIKGALGIGGGDEKYEQQIQAAAELTQKYADQLQEHLEEKDKWEQVRVAYLE